MDWRCGSSGRGLCREFKCQAHQKKKKKTGEREIIAEALSSNPNIAKRREREREIIANQYPEK
jgi:hypothetical protein